MQDTDGGADGAGDHVREFQLLLRRPLRRLGHTGHVSVKHGDGLFKERVLSGTLQQKGEKTVFSRVIADGKKVGIAHVLVILRMEAFHKREDVPDGAVLGSGHQRRDIFIMVIERTSDDAGLLDHVGYGDLR